MNVDLPAPGMPVMPIRCARLRWHSETQLLRQFVVVGLSGLDQGDRSGQHGPVTGTHAVGVCTDIDGTRPSMILPAGQFAQQVDGRVREYRARREIADAPGPAARRSPAAGSRRRPRS